jgi:NhaP-type Na+/H+ or K+/H+ antiporter
MKSDKIILGVLGGVAVGALLGFVCTWKRRQNKKENHG